MRRLTVVAAVAAFLVLPAAASADVTVNPVIDDDDGQCQQPPAGDCTLREAVVLSGETVLLPTGDYVLDEELPIVNNVTIRGDGARLTTIRLGNSLEGRVMSIVSPAVVNISRVRISGGNTPLSSGGGIQMGSGATLNLVDSAVTDNTADRGGGIASDGELHLVRVLIARNHAVGEESQANGGGILTHAGSATLENTTVSRNTAVDAGGAGQGGGIYASANLDLLNVTIAENSAGQGSFGDGGGLFQNYGIPTSGLRTVAVNTLVARNTGFNCAGTVDHPIQSTNGVSDELSQPSCNAPGPTNQLVADTRLGPLAVNGAATDTHALLAGSPGIDRGAAASCPAVDQRGISRPRGAGCDVGAYEYVPPVPSGPPPPPPDDELPPPEPGKSVNALPKSGTVKIKLPGSDKFVVLDEGQQIPVGTTVDVRKGRITLVAAADKNGGTATSDFYGGIFKISQTKGAKPITVLKLVEKLTCTNKKANAAAKKKRKRRLWGNGKGRFRTSGKYSSATVRGTKWLVEDRCTSTLTRVVRGKVAVRDFVKKKTVIVKAGKKYVAKKKKP